MVDDHIDSAPGHRGAPDRLVRLVEAAFFLLVGATIVCFLVKANGLGFRADDWRLAQRGRSIGDYFQPYNDSLAVVPIAIYRALYAVFGFSTEVPLRIVGVVSGAAIAVAMFFVVRARVGSFFALVAGSILLWYPDFSVIPATFDHYLALTAIILCAWLLTRDGIAADVSVALMLTFALCNAGLGVAGGVGALTYIALARAPFSRWVSVVVPMAAWATWWLLVSQTTRGQGEHSLSRMIELVFDGIAGSFRGLVFDSRALALVLATAFLMTLGWRLRRGIRASRNEIAWTVALVAWWVGLAYSRGALVAKHPVRYELVGSAFVLLAFLPTRVTTWRIVDRRVALAAGVALAAAVVLLNHGIIFENQRELADSYRRVRINTMVGNLDSAVVPDKTALKLGGLATLTAGTYRNLVAEFGAPPGSRPKDIDASIVALGDVHPVASRTAPSARCIDLGRSLSVRPESVLTLRAGARDVAVRLRRFERASTDVGTIPARSTATIGLPGPATRPWIVDAPGTCRVVDVHVEIRRPRPGARISGSTPIAAATSGTVEVATVEFRLRRGTHSDVTILPAKLSMFGWVYVLDASQLSNGRYTITSVATDEAGGETVSRSVTVTVDN